MKNSTTLKKAERKKTRFGEFINKSQHYLENQK